VTGPGGAVGGRIATNLDSSSATWFPVAALTPQAMYTVTLSDAIQDAAGNPLAAFSATFTVTDFRISQPQDGDPVVESQTITLAATGSNLSGVQAVTFTALETLVATAEAPLFEADYAVPSIDTIGGSTLTLSARAVIGGANIALGAATTGSSQTYAYGFGPELAADGNTDSNLNNGSVAVLLDESRAWWQADLGTSKRIQEINIHLMTGCCEASNRFAVLVADQPFVESDFESGELPLTYSNGAVTVYETTDDFDTGVVYLEENLAGRYVRVVSLDQTYLALAEVEIIEARFTVDAAPIELQVHAADGDADDDGVSNGDEVLAGTDPFNP
jgi:hypothetical protein